MFETLIGNNDIKVLLEEAMINKKISHSYIFKGEEGIGKKLFAREFAKNVMCLEDGKCYEHCNSCVKFNAISHPDYSEIYPDGKKIKISQIRKLQEKITEKPIISNKKIYLIDDADLMTEESQNCLLKTLEEPPEYAMIILIVRDGNELLSTIKSRCITIKFNNISNNELKQYLTNLTDKQIKLLRWKF